MELFQLEKLINIEGKGNLVGLIRDKISYFAQYEIALDDYNGLFNHNSIYIIH